MVEGGSRHCWGLLLPTGPGLWKPVTTFIFTLYKEGQKPGAGQRDSIFYCTPDVSPSSSIDFSVD